MRGFAGLLKIDMPSGTVRLTDGGFINFDGETYTSYSDILGQIATVPAISEGAQDEIPSVEISFNVPEPLQTAEYTTGALQQCAVRMWLVEYDVDTNEVVGTPNLQFLGQIDQPILRVNKTQARLSLSVVSKLEWFFEKDSGNTLSSAFHKSLYPGETGHDNASGLSVDIAWGIKGPPSSNGSSSLFGGRSPRDIVNQVLK